MKRKTTKKQSNKTKAINRNDNSLTDDELSLFQMVKRINNNNLHSEIKTGVIGKEIW